MNMNKLTIYVIYDTIAERHSNIWNAPNDEVAIRNAQKFVDKETAADFQLFALGEFDLQKNSIAAKTREVMFLPKDVLKEG